MDNYLPGLHFAGIMRGSLRPVCPSGLDRAGSGSTIPSRHRQPGFPTRIAHRPHPGVTAEGPPPPWPREAPLPFEVRMARVCQVTGKRTTTGNNVSHAMNKTRRRFLPNLHERRFWVASENRWVKLRVSSAALRTIDKNGIDAILADLRARGEKI